MALLKETAFTGQNFASITGEYWRISRVAQDRGISGDKAPSVHLQLFSNLASRQAEENPVWMGVVQCNLSDLDSWSIADIYSWLKANYQPLSGATDI